MIIATAGHVDHGKTTLVHALTGVATDRLAEEQRRGMTIDLGFAYADLSLPLPLPGAYAGAAGGVAGADAGAAADSGAGATVVDRNNPLASEPSDQTSAAPAWVGFIDVPGHERFIRNMLAGVAAVDLGLLVVAADDGPMPQTREHLAILRLLGVPRLVVALTKTDRVSAERLAAVHAELNALLVEPGHSDRVAGLDPGSVSGSKAGLQDGLQSGLQSDSQSGVYAAADTPPAAPPVFALATLQGTGVAALRRHLASVAQAWVARTVQGHFRLAVDRSFLLSGAGRIVTGTVLSGRVQVGDTVTVSPQGQSARVRSLHADHRPAQAAMAGQRCALNLAGAELKRGEPARGDWVLAPEAHAPSNRLDLWLQPVAGAPAISSRAQLQLHLGAAAVPVRLAQLGPVDGSSSSTNISSSGGGGATGITTGSTTEGAIGDAIGAATDSATGSATGGANRSARVADPAGAAPAPPQTPVLLPPPSFAQALSERPLHAVAGDRFILRDAASNRTLAGGWVIDPQPPARGRAQPARLAQLAALALPNKHDALAALLAISPDGVALAAFARARNLQANEAEALFKTPGVQALPHAGEHLGIGHARLQKVQQQLLAALALCHAQQPDSRGADEATLCQTLGQPQGSNRSRNPTPQLSVQRAALAMMVADGRVQRAGVVHHLPGHQAVLAEADATLLARVLAPLQAGGLRPPIVGELATLLDQPLPPLQEFLIRMAQRGLLVRVAPNRWYPPEAVAELAGHALALAQASPEGGCDAASYRDRTGIGRNLTVQVLEFLDRSGYTRFDGQRHKPM